MLKVPMSAKFIKRFDELNADKAGAENSLNIALNWHANRSNELVKMERELWDDVISSYPELQTLWHKGQPLQARMVEGTFCVTIAEEHKGDA